MLETSKLPVGLLKASRPSKEPSLWKTPETDQRTGDWPNRLPAVIHSWAVPALGIKIDSVPGRMNETWMRITRPGVYYGQCSELCGINHAFMPIAVEAVSKADFKNWLVKAKVKFKAENSLQNVEPKLMLAGFATGPARGE